jgi:hypothetical protein
MKHSIMEEDFITHLQLEGGESASGFKTSSHHLTRLYGGTAEGDVKLTPLLPHDLGNPGTLTGYTKVLLCMVG